MDHNTHPPHLTEEDVLGRPPSPPDRRVPWAGDERGYADLRVPAGDGPHPVAVLVHGGCWRDIADLHYLEPLALALGEAGWATWNLGFRRLGDPGGGWPGTFLDVAAGTDHLKSVAPDAGLDLGRVVTVGHSSGGHLALWLAARPRVPSGSDLSRPHPLPVRGAVSLAGIGDLAAFHALERRACDEQVARLLGGEPDEAPDRLAAASPAELLPLGVPQLLVTGEDDEDVPAEHVEEYAWRARREGDAVRHHRVARAGHFEVVAPWAEAWDRVEPAILEFLDEAAPG